MNQVEAEAKRLNVSVARFDQVFTNVLNYTHDHACFKIEENYIKTKGVEDLSYFFSFYFPLRPRVFVTLTGLGLKRNLNVLDTFLFQEIQQNDIFNDHFTLNLMINRQFLTYTLVELCYYATVNLVEFIPPEGVVVT